MAIVINGSGTISGISVGGLPDGTVDAGTVAADVATQAEIDAKLNLAGGALTGALTTNSTIDGRDVAADGVLATNALPKSGGTLTGDLIVGDTSSNQSSIRIRDDDTSVYIGAEASACWVGMDSGIASGTNLGIYADGRGLSQFTAKAWLQMDMSNMSINDSHNFSSITDIATGQARCNYSNALGNATPAVATSGPAGYISATSNVNSTSFYLRSGDSNWSAVDTDKNMAIVFAD